MSKSPNSTACSDIHNSLVNSNPNPNSTINPNSVSLDSLDWSDAYLNDDPYPNPNPNSTINTSNFVFDPNFVPNPHDVVCIAYLNDDAPLIFNSDVVHDANTRCDSLNVLPPSMDDSLNHLRQNDEVEVIDVENASVAEDNGENALSLLLGYLTSDSDSDEEDAPVINLDRGNVRGEPVQCATESTTSDSDEEDAPVINLDRGNVRGEPVLCATESTTFDKDAQEKDALTGDKNLEEIETLIIGDAAAGEESLNKRLHVLNRTAAGFTPTLHMRREPPFGGTIPVVSPAELRAVTSKSNSKVGQQFAGGPVILNSLEVGQQFTGRPVILNSLEVSQQFAGGPVILNSLEVGQKPGDLEKGAPPIISGKENAKIDTEIAGDRVTGADRGLGTAGAIPLNLGEPGTRSIIRSGGSKPWVKGPYTIYSLNQLTRLGVVEVFGDVKCSACLEVFPSRFNLIHERGLLTRELQKFKDAVSQKWVNGTNEKCLLCSRRDAAGPVLCDTGPPDWLFLWTGRWIGRVPVDMLKNYLWANKVKSLKSSQTKLIYDVYASLLKKLIA